MIRPGTQLALALALALAGTGCARSKSQPAPSASASSQLAASAPASIPAPGRIKLCSDGLHKPGDHWKEACNPCRCAADGEITCAQFPCAGGAAKPDAGGAAP